MKEYGSSVQKLVDNMVNIEDREKRTRYAHILIELMRQIHPGMKEGQDYYNKLWDDLYIISNFTLDVDSPYPPPSKESLGKKPQTVPYNTHRLKFKHFGRNVDLLIAKATALEEADERRAFVSYLVRLMRTFYQAWNKEAVEDETIYEGLIELSNGKLYDDIELIRQEGLVESTPRERAGEATQPQRIGSGNNNNRNQNGGQGRNNSGTGNDRRNFNGSGNNNRNQNGGQGRNNSGTGNDRRNFNGNGNNPRNQGGSGQNRNNNDRRRR